MKFTNSLIINASRREVFAYLSNLENIPAWNYAIESTLKKAGSQVGVGAVYTQIRTIPRRAEEVVRIVAYEPDSLLAINGDFGPVTGTATYRLEASGANQTRLINTFDLRAPGALNFVGDLIVLPIKNAVAKNLQVLKDIMERS